MDRGPGGRARGRRARYGCMVSLAVKKNTNEKNRSRKSQRKQSSSEIKLQIIYFDISEFNIDADDKVPLALRITIGRARRVAPRPRPPPPERTDHAIGRDARPRGARRGRRHPRLTPNRRAPRKGQGEGRKGPRRKAKGSHPKGAWACDFLKK